MFAEGFPTSRPILDVLCPKRKVHHGWDLELLRYGFEKLGPLRVASTDGEASADQQTGLASLDGSSIVIDEDFAVHALMLLRPLSEQIPPPVGVAARPMR